MAEMESEQRLFAALALCSDRQSRSVLCLQSVVLRNDMSLAEHQYLARGVFHYKINGWVDLLYIASHTNRRICHQYQVRGLHLCFTYNSWPGIARLHYVFVHCGHSLFRY